MMRRLLQWIGGWVEVEVRSAAIAELLTRLAAAGIWVARAEPTSAGARWRMTLSGVGRLRLAARGLRVRVRFGRRGGLPAWWRRARVRPGLVVGAIGAAACVMWAAPRVWVVAVTGAPPEVEARVVAAAAAAGLRPGVLRDRIHITRLAADIERRVPGLAWVGISFHGTVADLSLYRLRARPPELGPTPWLVAARAAKIVAVRVYFGEALVAPDQEVSPGTPLVRAFGVEAGQSASAAGEVIGRYRVQATVREPRDGERLEPTGRRFTQTFVVMGEDYFQVGGPGPIPFARFSRAVDAEPLSWFGQRLPGTLIRVVYNELTAMPVTRTLAQARALARAAARAALLRKVPRGARITSEDVRCAPTPSGAACTASAEVEQNIAVAARTATDSRPPGA